MKLQTSALFLSLLTFFVLSHAMESPGDISPSPRKSPISPAALAYILNALGRTLTESEILELQAKRTLRERTPSPRVSPSMADRLNSKFQAEQDQDSVRVLAYFHQQPPNDAQKPSAQRN